MPHRRLQIFFHSIISKKSVLIKRIKWISWFEVDGKVNTIILRLIRTKPKLNINPIQMVVVVVALPLRGLTKPGCGKCGKVWRDNIGFVLAIQWIIGLALMSIDHTIIIQRCVVKKSIIRNVHMQKVIVTIAPMAQVFLKLRWCEFWIRIASLRVRIWPLECFGFPCLVSDLLVVVLESALAVMIEKHPRWKQLLYGQIFQE